jgi:hypothetical protein
LHSLAKTLPRFSKNQKLSQCPSDGLIAIYKSLQPIDLDWATVIGVTSFLAEDIYNPDRANCVDRSGIPLSYFADVQAGWDWIYETIEGKKLISPAYIYPK